MSLFLFKPLTEEIVMPKNRSTKKTKSGLVVAAPAHKFLIGTRKGGKSAHTMSTEALMEVLSNKGQKKFHQKALTVLKCRGVEVTAKLTETDTVATA